MNILDLFKSREKKKQDIVARLISRNQITGDEAALLLYNQSRISIGKIEMSSGAKITQGDDNSIKN